MLPGAQHVPGRVSGHGGHNGEGPRHSAFKFHCPVKIEVISISSCRWLCVENSQGDDLEDDEDKLLHYSDLEDDDLLQGYSPSLPCLSPA